MESNNEEDLLVLSVGHVCVDVISVCNFYPEEDSKVWSAPTGDKNRCIEQRWQRGGNASNSASVLAELNQPCEYLGTMARAPQLSFVLEDFKSSGIQIDNCKYYDNCDFPSSTVIINKSNGSRTIIHANRNLPELKLEDITALDLTRYKWIHFEGRNIPNVINMLEYLNTYNTELTYSPGNSIGNLIVSVEVEKNKPNILDTIPLADVVFLGKDMAQFLGYNNMTEAVSSVGKRLKERAVVFCAWGEKGAAAFCPRSGKLVTSPAYPPTQVVDTLGAGDTFIAAAIDGLCRGLNLQDTISWACQVAGTKCGMAGFRGLKKALEERITL